MRVDRHGDLGGRGVAHYIQAQPLMALFLVRHKSRILHSHPSSTLHMMSLLRAGSQRRDGTPRASAGTAAPFAQQQRAWR